LPSPGRSCSSPVASGAADANRSRSERTTLSDTRECVPMTDARAVAARILGHLVRRIGETPALADPFGHTYLTDVFPPDLYRELLDALPDPGLYDRAAERHHNGEAGGYVRAGFALTAAGLGKLPPGAAGLVRGGA